MPCVHRTYLLCSRATNCPQHIHTLHLPRLCPACSPPRLPPPWLLLQVPQPSEQGILGPTLSLEAGQTFAIAFLNRLPFPVSAGDLRMA